MLRFVFRLRQRRQTDLESWPDYMKRTACEAERLAIASEFLPWKYAYRRRQWRFARQIVRQIDGRWSQWSQKVLAWIPSDLYCRDAGRPRERWTDSLEGMQEETGRPPLKIQPHGVPLGTVSCASWMLRRDKGGEGRHRGEHPRAGKASRAIVIPSLICCRSHIFAHLGSGFFVGRHAFLPC